MIDTRVIALLTLLTGCTYQTPQGMVITETHYTSTSALYAVCKAEACVFTDEKTYCYMHLPLAANGDPMYREHELSHCAGRKDPPI